MSGWQNVNDRLEAQKFFASAVESVSDAGVVTWRVPPSTRLEDGTVTAPEVAWTDDSDTGLYRVGANQVGLATGGVQRVVVDEFGRIGVNTPSPDSELHLNGVLHALSVFSGAAQAASQCVYDGDSLTFNGYPLEVSTTITFEKSNVAVGGATILDAILAAPRAVDALHSRTSRFNLVVFWAGTNDVYLGDTPQTAYNRLVAYANGRRQQGFKVIVGTMISRVGLDSEKNTLNALTRANWQTFADGIVDLGATTELGADGAYLNATYFQSDGTHLTAAGYTFVAGQVSAAINAFTSANDLNVVRVKAPGSTTNSSGQFGSFEIQSYAVNNGWLADNLYYDGAFKYRSDGFGMLVYFAPDGSVRIATAPSGTAGASVVPDHRLTVTAAGKIILGATPTHADEAAASAEVAGTIYKTSTGELRIKL
jgi:lysophospholipase L1-like esterase